MTLSHFLLFFTFLTLRFSHVFLTSEVQSNTVSLSKCCEFNLKIDNQTQKCSSSHENSLVDGENGLFFEEAEKLLSKVITGNSSRYGITLTRNFHCPAGHFKLIPFDGNVLNVQNNVFISETKLQFNEGFNSSQEICLERSSNDATVVMYICEAPAPTSIAKESSHKSPSSLRKCCKEGESVVHSGNNFSCVQSNYEQWNPPTFHSIDDDGPENNVSELKEDHGFPNCNVKQLNNSQDIWFITLEDGSVRVGLKFWFRPVWLKVNPELACVDTSNQTSKSNTSRVLQHNGNIPVDVVEDNLKSEILLYCSLEQFDDYVFHRKLFGGLCMTSSLIILCLLMIYASIWNRQNMAGWTQFNLFLSLFVVFGMEGLRVLTQPNGLDAKQTSTCFIIAAIAQYFFFTVNTTWSVMCFDLFWTFWRLESGDIPATKHPKRIMAYFTVSWIVPLITTVIAFFAVHVRKNDPSASNKMSFAHRRCSSPIRELGFTTQGIFFLVNLLFFLFTAIFIYKHQRSMRNVKRANVMKSNWLSVKLFLKLLVVMGVASVTVPLDFFFGGNDPLSFFSALIRVTHFIPSWAAFWIFGFNERNVKMLRKKFPAFRKFWDSWGCSKAGINTSVDTAHGGPAPSGVVDNQRSSC